MNSKLSKELFLQVDTLSDIEKKFYSIELIEKTVNIFNPNWTTDFSEMKNRLRTGDLILVHGKYQYSWVAELLQWGKWTHTAMVIRSIDIDPDNLYKFPDLMLWESNTGDQKVINLWGQNNTIKEGPMLVSLEDRLKNTSTYLDVQIVHRPLHCYDLKPIFENLKSYFDSVINCGFPTDPEVIHSIYLGRKYNRATDNPLNDINLFIDFDSSIVQVLKIDVKNILQNLPDYDINNPIKKIYCSQLIAETYKKIGLLTNNHVSNAYSPKDFSIEGEICLLLRSWLGLEMFIDMTK